MADDEKKTDTAASTGEQSKAGRLSTPPKAFWWRALLMIAVVWLLFSTIRDLADGQSPATATNAPAAFGTSALPMANEEDITVEEAPSLPPADNMATTPGYYDSPYPPSQPGQGNGAFPPPPYPQQPQGGYPYPYAPQYPGYPPRYPWYAPYPPMGYGYPVQPERTPNNTDR